MGPPEGPPPSKGYGTLGNICVISSSTIGWGVLAGSLGFNVSPAFGYVLGTLVAILNAVVVGHHCFKD